MTFVKSFHIFATRYIVFYNPFLLRMSTVETGCGWALGMTVLHRVPHIPLRRNGILYGSRNLIFMRYGSRNDGSERPDMVVRSSVGCGNLMENASNFFILIFHYLGLFSIRRCLILGLGSFSYCFFST